MWSIILLLCFTWDFGSPQEMSPTVSVAPTSVMELVNDTLTFFNGSFIDSNQTMNETSMTEISTTETSTQLSTQAPETTVDVVTTIDDPLTTLDLHTTSPDQPVTTTTTDQSVTTMTSDRPSTTTTTAQPTTTTMVATRLTTTKIPKTRRPSRKKNIVPPSTTAATTTTTTTTTSTTSAPSTTPASIPQEPCVFLEDNFLCDVEVSCFGEGEIDCTDIETEEENRVLSSPQILNKGEETSEPIEEESSTVAEADYEGLFPEDLLSILPPRKRLPFLWKIQSLATNALATATVTAEAHTRAMALAGFEESTSLATGGTEVVPSVVTIPVGTDVPSEAMTTEVSRINDETSPVDNGTGIPSDTTIFVASGVGVLSETTISAINDTGVPYETAISLTNDTSNSSNQTMSSTTTFLNRSTNSAVVEDALIPLTPSELSASRTDSLLVVSRRRRESPSALMTLRGPKDKACVMTGNVYCSPVPSTAFCTGRRICRVESSAEEQSSDHKVESWAVAVIAICASAAALTVGLLVYLVITSWKKLKVQPQNGVTTLNYVNSSPP